MASILIIVGTESGNAQMAADYLSDELSPLGHDIEIVNDGTADDARLDERSVALVCTATHGDGELPDNLIPFHQNLAEKRPDLSHLRYGVIALGDQTYADTYCNAGRTFDALLAELGAHKVGERLEIDACTQPLPDEDALDWAKVWIEMV